jgi:hypothetical protein
LKDDDDDDNVIGYEDVESSDVFTGIDFGNYIEVFLWVAERKIKRQQKKHQIDFKMYIAHRS